MAGQFVCVCMCTVSERTKKLLGKGLQYRHKRHSFCQNHCHSRFSVSHSLCVPQKATHTLEHTHFGSDDVGGGGAFHYIFLTRKQIQLCLTMAIFHPLVPLVVTEEDRHTNHTAYNNHRSERSWPTVLLSERERKEFIYH